MLGQGPNYNISDFTDSFRYLPIDPTHSKPSGLTRVSCVPFLYFKLNNVLVYNSTFFKLTVIHFMLLNLKRIRATNNSKGKKAKILCLIVIKVTACWKRTNMYYLLSVKLELAPLTVVENFSLTPLVKFLTLTNGNLKNGKWH